MHQKIIQTRKPEPHQILNGDIQEDLEELNYKFKSILGDEEERILFRPILAYKLKPDKNAFLGLIQANWRSFVFTNRKLYNMDPKVYNDGDVDRDKLIKN